MKTFKNLKERLNTLNKKGVSAMEIPIAIMGLLVATIFIVELLPGIIANFTGMTVTGSGGVILTTIMPLIIIFGIFYMILKHMGIKGMGGK